MEAKDTVMKCREEGVLYQQLKQQADISFKAGYTEGIKVANQSRLKQMGKMPRINPHASYIKGDKQLREQMRWLKSHGFKNAREAQEKGY